jgi:hypothetical protein
MKQVMREYPNGLAATPDNHHHLDGVARKTQKHNKQRFDDMDEAIRLLSELVTEKFAKVSDGQESIANGLAQVFKANDEIEKSIEETRAMMIQNHKHHKKMNRVIMVSDHLQRRPIRTRMVSEA